MSNPLDSTPVAAESYIRGIPSLVGTRLNLTQVDYSRVLRVMPRKRVWEEAKRVTGYTINSRETSSVFVLDWSTATLPTGA